jgi:hypothetical protein
VFGYQSIRKRVCLAAFEPLFVLARALLQQVAGDKECQYKMSKSKSKQSTQSQEEAEKKELCGRNIRVQLFNRRRRAERKPTFLCDVKISRKA